LEEAVRQAQVMQLLPPHAVVDKTAPGIQVSLLFLTIGQNLRSTLLPGCG